MTDEAPMAVEALIALKQARKYVWGDSPHTKRVEIADAIDKAAAALAAQAQRIAELERENATLAEVHAEEFDRAEKAAAALAALTAENESLRAECGLRQIRGYNEGKAKAEAALRQAPPREPTEAMIRAGSAKYTCRRPWDDIETIWRAMYDAAPAAAPGEKP